MTEWGEQRGLVECCEAGRLLATVQSTCSPRDVSRDDNRHDSDDINRSCTVVHDVCCLAEHRQVRCRRGVSHGLAATTSHHHRRHYQQQQQHIDDYDCRPLTDDAKVQYRANACFSSLKPLYVTSMR